MTRRPDIPTCHHCGHKVGLNEYDHESDSYYSTHWSCHLAAERRPTSPDRPE